MNALQIAMEHWEQVAPVLTTPTTEADYEQMVENLDAVLDAGGADENNPLSGLAGRMGDLIAAYEGRHYPIESTGVDALAYLMDTHNLRQDELPEVGSQGVVSEVLHGKRELNIRQIRALSSRFNVSAQVFI